MNPLLNPPNGTIVKIVSFLLSQRIPMVILPRKPWRDLQKREA